MKQCNESGKMRQKWDISASGTKLIGGPCVKLLHKFIYDNLFLSRPNKRSGSVDVTKVWPLLHWSTNIMWLMADKELVRAAAAPPRLRCEATLWQFLFPVSFDKQSPVAAGTQSPVSPDQDFQILSWSEEWDFVWHLTKLHFSCSLPLVRGLIALL